MSFSVLRPVVNQLVGRFRSEGPLYWEALKTTNKDAFQKKISNLNNWYTRLLGLDEVKLYQDRVVALQERLLEAQDTRRKIGRSLAEIRKKSNFLQDEIHKVKRQEDLDRFLSLMKEETEVLRQENQVTREFQECDQTERELFTAFTNAVRDSHEKQRAQLEYTKYFGIILSIAGSFLAFCYTTLRKDDLKKFIEQNLARNPEPLLITKSGDNGDLIKLVKSETARLSEMISFRNSEAASILEKEKETKKRQFLVFVGTGALFLIVYKLIN